MSISRIVESKEFHNTVIALTGDVEDSFVITDVFSGNAGTFDGTTL
jgi:hypothetical protein